MSRRNRGIVHNGGRNDVQTPFHYRCLLQSKPRRDVKPRPTWYHRHRKLRVNAKRTTDGRPYVVRRHRELRINANRTTDGRPYVVRRHRELRINAKRTTATPTIVHFVFNTLVTSKAKGGGRCPTAIRRTMFLHFSFKLFDYLRVLHLFPAVELIHYIGEPQGAQT